MRMQVHSSKLVAQGFSLVEMILVAAIGAFVIMAAASIAISETKASIKTYAIQGLRDKFARVTYFIEGEVSEGDRLSLSPVPSCSAPANPYGGSLGVVFLFSLRHRMTKPQGLADVYTCYYNVAHSSVPGTNPNNWSLYRYGPAIGDSSGVIGIVAAAGDSTPPASLNPGNYVVSPYTYVYDITLNRQSACGTSGQDNVEDAIKYSCDGRTLSYRMRVGSGTSSRDSIWNATYPAATTTTKVYARARIL